MFPLAGWICFTSSNVQKGIQILISMVSADLFLITRFKLKSRFISAGSALWSPLSIHGLANFSFCEIPLACWGIRAFLFSSMYSGCARLKRVVEGCLVMDDTGRRWSCWWSEKWKMKLMLVVQAVTDGAVLAAAGTERKKRS
ncbi:hypothetical protein POTOM_037936 [Populus tomentosa]|uniref:Uncharacterized protein n=1 Tax=Populus tomentosa TaxID=118781 RepID=A0A8X7YV18_POPTO|nr:hypothetical protein POTOM_037936 [Populus tomentosa]